MISRRRFMVLTGAVLATPAFAQEPFAASTQMARGMDQLHALLIAHRGQTVVDMAFRGPPTTRTVNVKSVSKTINAAVLGAAVDRGIVRVADQLGDVAPELIPRGADPRVSRLTLENLVTMTAGLGRTSGANYGAWVSSPNWVSYALTRPFEAEPGGRMLYSTGSFHILGAALAEVTDKNLLTLTREWIGQPLGIDIPAWTRDPQGFYFGGNEMGLTPRAMLAFGEMARKGGDGVLSADWMRASMQMRTRSPFSGLDYGYGWFLGRAGGADIALARGYGGQIICIVPEAETTIAITSDASRPARSEGYFGDLMRLLDVIVPEALAL